MEKKNIGDAVTFYDSYKVKHPALVTNVFSATCVNLVFVSEDDNKKDDYGRQLERHTSVSHISVHGGSVGMCWE